MVSWIKEKVLLNELHRPVRSARCKLQHQQRVQKITGTYNPAQSDDAARARLQVQCLFNINPIVSR